MTLPQYSHCPEDVMVVGAPQFGQFVVITLAVFSCVLIPVFLTNTFQHQQILFVVTYLTIMQK